MITVNVTIVIRQTYYSDFIRNLKQKINNTDWLWILYFHRSTANETKSAEPLDKAIFIGVSENT